MFEYSFSDRIYSQKVSVNQVLYFVLETCTTIMSINTRNGSKAGIYMPWHCMKSLSVYLTCHMPNAEDGGGISATLSLSGTAEPANAEFPQNDVYDHYVMSRRK